MSKQKMPISIGVQTFGLAQELSQDFDGTFTRMKAMGFDSVEPFICMVEKQGKFPANLWSYALYVVSVRQTEALPIGNFSSLNPASFRLHLTMDALAFS